MADSASTIIGESILVSGSLQGDEDLTVLGRVHGNVTLTKTLVVEESGIVKADVDVRNAIVSGIVVGNIIASDSVELTEQGRCVGDIKAPRIIIVDGARFRGNVDMGDLEQPRPSGPLPSRNVERPGAKGGGMSSMTSMSRPTAAATRPSSTPARRPPPPPPAKGKKKAPVAAKKKIKKKVVVKRKGR